MRKLLFPAAALLVAAAAATYWFGYRTTPSQGTFRTEPATRGELTAVVTATGTVEPVDVVDVGAQVAGQITAFGVGADGKPIDYNSPVEPGTVLAKIDDSLYQAQADQSRAAVRSAERRIDQAKAKVEQARANIELADANQKVAVARFNQADRDWARIAQLVGTVSQADRDAAEAAYETNKAGVAVANATVVQAKAALRDAEAAVLDTEASLAQAQAVLKRDETNLGYCTIKSTVKGQIIDRRVTLGQTVQSSFNTPSLFLIAKDLHQMKVWASVNEADIARISVGQEVRFSVDALPERVFAGKVELIRKNATNTQNVVTYTVEVLTDNADLALEPYMTASLQFTIARRTDALLVPNAALRYKPAGGGTGDRPVGKDGATTKGGDKSRGASATVWVEEDGKPHPIRLKIGLTDGNVTEVLSGDLQPGTQLIVGEVRAKAGGSDATNAFAPNRSSKR